MALWFYYTRPDPTSWQRNLDYTGKPTDSMYSEIKPCPALEPYIHCYWAIDEQAGTILHDNSFPDGCPEIIFNLETQVQRFTNDGQVFINPSVELIGQMTRPYRIQTQGKNRIVGIRFYPHTFACFTKEPLTQFTDHTLSVQDLFGGQIQEVADQLAEAPTPAHWVDRLNHFFQCRLSSQCISNRYKLANFAVHQLFTQKESARIDAIAQASGVSHRYLQQCFEQFVGVSPKMLLKIIRFQKTFQYLNAGTYSLTAVAYECGYYDQAHFIHEFRAFTGITPGQYTQEQHPFNQHFLTASNSSYLYNF